MGPDIFTTTSDSFNDWLHILNTISRNCGVPPHMMRPDFTMDGDSSEDITEDVDFEIVENKLLTDKQ